MVYLLHWEYIWPWKDARNPRDMSSRFAILKLCSKKGSECLALFLQQADRRMFNLPPEASAVAAAMCTIRIAL